MKSSDSQNNFTQILYANTTNDNEGPKRTQKSETN